MVGANRHSGLLAKHTELAICRRKITRRQFDDLAVINNKPRVDIPSYKLSLWRSVFGYQVGTPFRPAKGSTVQSVCSNGAFPCPDGITFQSSK